MRRRSHAHRVAGRAPRKRQIEHHEHKTESRKDGDQRDGAVNKTRRMRFSAAYQPPAANT